jgi:cytosine/adenosine deaminase-related metal-dependent hydrolase
MPTISTADFPAEGYALHVDVALGPRGPLHDAVLIVEHGVIVDLSTAATYGAPPDRPRAVRLPGTAILPGILDVHHHIIEPFVKALTGGEPAQMWKRIWLPLEATLTERSAYFGAKWTFLEALRGGITTVVDHGIRTRAIADAIHRAAHDTGIRLVSSTGVYDLKNFSTSARTPDLVKDVDAAIRIAEQHVEDCAAFSRVLPSLACGTVQSNSGDMIKALARFCRERGILFQIHANEHTLEVHASIEATGRRPIEYLSDLDALGHTTLIAHATLVTGAEMELLRATDTAIAYNPVAAMWKGNAIAPALDYMTRGIRVGLGSDATRNDGLRMIDAAEACQRIAFGIPRDDFSCGAGWRWVHAATQGGADAALLGDEVGSLAPGRKADFLLLDCQGPEVRPSWDFTWEIVRFFDRADILATFVEGEPVQVGGRSTRFDNVTFLDGAEAEGVQAVHDAGLIRLHGTADSGWPGNEVAPRPSQVD